MKDWTIDAGPGPAVAIEVLQVRLLEDGEDTGTNECRACLVTYVDSEDATAFHAEGRCIASVRTATLAAQIA